jgi:hypothetical protein
VSRTIDLNRGILQADERDYFGSRFGGQLASGVLLPFGADARGADALARHGAAEGAVTGFGAGEGNPFQRVPSALTGAAIGATGSYALGRVIDVVAPVVRSAFGRPKTASALNLNQVQIRSQEALPFNPVRAERDADADLAAPTEQGRCSVRFEGR